MKALQIGMIEMNSAVAAERITEALKSQVLPAADRILRIDDEVMVYRETDKIWYPGYTVKNILGKQVQVIDRLGEEKHFSLHQVKRAPPHDHASTESV
jgi:Reverse transcriptase (RNA-dependent DNA polymerase)